MFGFALQLQSDSELQRGTPNSLQANTVGAREPKEAVCAGPITQIGCEAGTDIVAAASDSCNGPYVGQPSVGNSH
jgi:hypothetical protein